ncbi:peroxiredoxin-like family protein [Mesorhizobium xinjiangense]|uniref:peroxiredoxin-like family protein n=1 Tax=Mesorhizobium xinjiangense TaxID=2678685 RepID=UPI0018DD546A|nr:peroxiredoxin-like family protein [Mesorhizobium xinjiangense]
MPRHDQSSAEHSLPNSMRISEIKARALREAAEYLIASRQAERALSAGSHAPAFRLRDQDGVEVSSELLLRRGPILLTFYGGSWCPACAFDLEALEKMQSAVVARGASLVCVSQQTPAENRRARAIAGVTFPILGDTRGKVASQFGVRWRIPELLRDLHRAGGVDLPTFNGEDSWTLPIPARFVVGSNGIIEYSEVDPDQTRRSDPRDMLPVLDQLSRPRAA